MHSPASRRDAWILLGLALTASLFLGVGLGRYGVVNADEAIYHAIAEHMAASGDWLRLDFRGEPRVYDAFLNAPLHYWARAAMISVFGSSYATMRILSAVFGVATVLVTFGLARRLADRRSAIFAALVQLTTYQFVYLHGARTGELDTLATFLVAAAAFTFHHAVTEQRSFVLHHLCLAALVMTKAPLVLIPLAVELAWLVWRREARPRLRGFLATGIALLPVALAWHGVQLWIHGEEALAVLRTMLDQASGARPDVADVGALGNARFYVGVLLYGAFPYSLAYPFAIAAAIGRRPEAARRSVAVLFATSVFGFFLLVSKHYPWYVMPMYPFLSVLLGAWLADLTRRDLADPARRELADPARPEGWARTAWGCGAVGAGAVWLTTGSLDANPFAERALTIPMETTARTLLGVGPWIAIPALAFAWAALVWRTRESAGRLRIAATTILAVALVGYAAVRSAAPLAHLGHRSALEERRQEIETARAAGRLRLPISLQVVSLQIARFHFGEDFEIVPVLVDDIPRIELHPAGEPSVLDRSIGRRGLERHFATGIPAR